MQAGSSSRDTSLATTSARSKLISSYPILADDKESSRVRCRKLFFSSSAPTLTGLKESSRVRCRNLFFSSSALTLTGLKESSRNLFFSSSAPTLTGLAVVALVEGGASGPDVDSETETTWTGLSISLPPSSCTSTLTGLKESSRNLFFSSSAPTLTGLAVVALVEGGASGPDVDSETETTLTGLSNSPPPLSGTSTLTGAVQGTHDAGGGIR